jgi:hypothetical protein
MRDRRHKLTIYGIAGRGRDIGCLVWTERAGLLRLVKDDDERGPLFERVSTRVAERLLEQDGWEPWDGPSYYVN